jgi:hypothetical protein
MAKLSTVFSHAIRRAERSATAGYTNKLRNHVSSYGWPEHLVSQISMSHNGESHAITYPEHLENEILTLEYGTPSVPPSPALRTFMIGGI